jgi:hypothetical protein
VLTWHILRRNGFFAHSEISDDIIHIIKNDISMKTESDEQQKMSYKPPLFLVRLPVRYR